MSEIIVTESTVIQVKKDKIVVEYHSEENLVVVQCVDAGGQPIAFSLLMPQAKQLHDVMNRVLSHPRSGRNK